MVGISSVFSVVDKNWLVYQPILSVVDKKKFVYQPVLSVVDNIGWYISRMCLAWTILVGKSTGFVFHGQ